MKNGYLYIFFFLSVGITAQTISIDLNTDWEFRQVGTETWYPATVPGTVHTDLLANGLIDDPFKDNNEKQLQWIEKVNWEYRTTFDVNEEQFNQKHHELNFEGLDTYAAVFLNGEQILDANNMFRSWRVDVSGQLKERGNELLIVFTSPMLKNDSIARANVKLPGGSDTSEYPVWPYTRKAAYHFGWDFSPRFVTSGIWKDIRLVSWSSFKLLEVSYQNEGFDEEKAELSIYFFYNSTIDALLEIEIDEVKYIDTLRAGNRYYTNSYFINDPKLWWPNCSGSQFLYQVNLTIYTQKDTLAFDSQRIGFRTIELVNKPDNIGTSFYFKVNGKPIFIKGSNYVPQDVFLPRVRPEQYERLLKQVKDAGMNMLRVWGGGVYEKDIFYDLCDEYGILIWQDFMFAGTMYPFDDLAFLENISGEVEEQVFRLKKHACIALWCGNNEIEVAWKNWGWQKLYRYSKSDSIALWNGYEDLFERAITRFMGEVNGIYISTSPQSNWGTTENFNHGSMHYWGVWHGQDDFSGFEKNIGRFMVEWGFQSYPDYDLLTEYVSPDQLSLNSEVMQNRQKSYVGNGKITDFLQRYDFVPEENNFEDFVKKSQDLQAYGYGLALQAHLKKQPHCTGTLLWQLNDCWPGASWSIINYNGKPKEAYEVVKEAFTD